jgi:DNA-binding transcriptional LysR family regulator
VRWQFDDSRFLSLVPSSDEEDSRLQTVVVSGIESGLGVSVVPAFSVQNAPRGVRTLRLSPRQYRRIGLLLPKGVLPTTAVEIWLAFVQSRF